MKPAQRKVAYGELSRHPFGSSDREQSEAARFMGGVSYAAIRETLPNVTASMDYLQGVARAVSSENKSISWTTPKREKCTVSFDATKRCITKGSITTFEDGITIPIRLPTGIFR